ncbi:MAG TPA: hypothetical protein VHL57_05770, partial [Flavobacteriales bacterium]|nr:hypothetical protein [Flavobacteriales bacterium]
MRSLVALFLLVALALDARAQKVPEPKPSFQGFLLLPVALHSPVFEDITEVLGQLDGSFQLPLWKGLGVGAGATFNWYGLEEHGLAQTTTIGEVRRQVFYGQVQYERYTGRITYYQFAAKFGQATWAWECTTCMDNMKQSAFHWGLTAAYFVHASDNLAFGLTLG